MFTIHVIHTSHTDLGYTDTQEKMAAHHVGFIREALALIEQCPGFHWTCESFLCVERFLAEAAPAERETLAKAVQSGRMCLSGSYLNLTDIIPSQVQHEVMNRCEKIWAELGVKVRSALTADINGYSWGFSDVLAAHGVTRLMSSIHTHHGYHPLMCKQKPFRWQTPEGRSLLVWNGDHYNLGCELGIAQTPSFEYTIHDGLSSEHMPAMERAAERIERYVASLKEQGYPYDFVPVSVSSEMTDNAPPSLAIDDFIQRYNALNTGIVLKESTLDIFFDELEQSSVEIPVYRGDWTDWWADGVASTPHELSMYRRACRNYALVSAMDPGHRIAASAVWREALDDLMLYGEHTWGYSSSITEPYHPQVNNLNQWKGLYALKASESATILREKLQQSLGETPVSVERELKFRAVNPYDHPVRDMLVIDLEHFYGHKHFRLICEETGENVNFQISRYSRGLEMCIDVALDAHETKTYALVETPQEARPSAGRLASTGIEGVDDLAWHLKQKIDQGGCATPFGLENEYLRIDFQRDKGVTSIWDKRKERELTDSSKPCHAFTPIYEVTHPRADEDELTVRRNMGRNRKSFRTERDIGTLKDVRVLENGPLFSRAELCYELKGTQFCSVILTLYHNSPRLGIDLRLHKDSVWDPENLYLALPFAGRETWLDKAGALMRPRIDQLPGTCVDFYAVQNGLVFAGEDQSTLLVCQDSPLITMGDMETHPIQLMGEDVSNNAPVYAWIMNNFWETNFNACLAGFYQFHFDLMVTPTTNPTDAFEELKQLNQGVLQFYLFEGKREIANRI